MTVSDRSLAFSVFATHGLLDAVVTAAVFAATESTLVESNPVLVPLLESALWNAAHEMSPSVVPYLGPFFVVKIGAVSLAVLSLWFCRSLIPRWRTFTALLTCSGFVIVVNNVAAIL